MRISALRDKNMNKDRKKSCVQPSGDGSLDEIWECNLYRRANKSAKKAHCQTEIFHNYLKIHLNLGKNCIELFLKYKNKSIWKYKKIKICSICPPYWCPDLSENLEELGNWNLIKEVPRPFEYFPQPCTLEVLNFTQADGMYFPKYAF